jgi:hypothetical protein
VYEDIEASFEGSVRYASGDVLQNLRNQQKITFRGEDDLFSMVKVFLGEILSVDKDLSNCLQEQISSLAKGVSLIWTKVTETYFWVEEFFQAAKEKNYEKVKRFMKGLLWTVS